MAIYVISLFPIRTRLQRHVKSFYPNIRIPHPDPEPLPGSQDYAIA